MKTHLKRMYRAILIATIIVAGFTTGCAQFVKQAPEESSPVTPAPPPPATITPIAKIEVPVSAPSSQSDLSVRICAMSAATPPCSPLANIFSDPNLTQPKSDQTPDSNGNYSFYVAPGMYVLEVAGNGVTTNDVSVAVLPTHAGVQVSPSTVQIRFAPIFSLTLAGNLTISGTLVAQQGISSPNMTITSSGGVVPPPPAAGGVTLFTGSDGKLYYEQSNGQIVGPLASSSSPTLPSSVALAPPPGSPIQYVAYTGSDNSDGLSWGSAKKTIMAAYDALPSAGGEIFIMSGAASDSTPIQATSTPGQGIWIMSPTDPNYSNPPPGWRRMKSAVTFMGVGGTSVAANSHFAGQVQVLAGGLSRNQPCIWLSGIQSPYQFENLKCTTAGRGIVLGESSNNLRDGSTSSNVSGITFINVAATPVQSPITGPGIDITGGSFWLYFQDCVFEGNYQAPSVLDNLHAAMLIDGTGNSGNGLIFVTNLNTNGGGIKFIPGANGGNLTVNGLTEEGTFPPQDTPPAIYLTSTSDFTDFHFENIEVADGSGPYANVAIQIDGNGPAEAVLVTGNIGPAGTVVGPATVMGQYGNGLINTAVSPAQNGQVGIFNGHIVGQVDAARRNFGPVAIRFPNISPQLATSWVVTQFAGLSTLTPGIPAPDGTTGAGRAQSTAPSPQEAVYFINNLVPTIQGDYFIGGAWIRSLAKNGGYSGSATTSIAFGAFDSKTNAAYQMSGNSQGAISSGQNEWTWQWFIYKIIGGITTNPSQVAFKANFDQNFPVEVYAPTLMHIPAGAVSDNEAYEIATNLSSYPDGLPAGTVATLGGQSLSFGGTGNFFGTLGQSNTANRTYLFPDASGHVALTDLSQTWAAPQSFGIENVADLNIDGETISHSPVMILPTFIPGTLSQIYTANTFTPDFGIIVTEVEITSKIGPAGCVSNAVVRVIGSNTVDVPISSSASNSGVISLSMAAGTPIQVILFTPAQACATVPQDANVVVHYRMQ